MRGPTAAWRATEGGPRREAWSSSTQAVCHGGVASCDAGTDASGQATSRVHVLRQRIVRGSPTRNALPFTLFDARSINFAIVVYSVFVHVEVDLH